jgi:hypothetical protein
MNVVKRIDQYDESCVFFSDSIRNNIINEGSFIRIIYSTKYVILNGIYLLITLHNINCEKYYTKYKCNFNVLQNKDIIENIKIIEENILAKIDIKNKIPQYKIYDQLKNGNLKIFADIGHKSICSFILKISGIWETQNNYGLTYKFMV